MIDYRLKLPASQQQVEKRLLAALQSEQFPRALLLVGAPGIGKRALAIELARILSCHSEERKPCGECLSCMGYKREEGKSSWFWILPIESGGKVIGGDDPAAVEARTEQTVKAIEATIKDPWETTSFSARSSIRIDSVRDVIRELGSKNKWARVVLIPEADRMELGAANALLKTLEEVPDKTYFILTTANRSDLLPTILSRCTQLHIPEAPLSEVGAFLEARGLSTENIGSIWALSSGSPGRALVWTGGRIEELREMALQLLEWAAAPDMVDAMVWWSQRRQSSRNREVSAFTKDDASLLLQIIALLLGDLAQLRYGLTIRNIDSSDRLSALPFAKEGIDTLREMMKGVEIAEKHLASNVTVERVVIALVLRWRNRNRLDLSWAPEEAM